MSKLTQFSLISAFALFVLLGQGCPVDKGEQDTTQPGGEQENQIMQEEEPVEDAQMDEKQDGDEVTEGQDSTWSTAIGTGAGVEFNVQLPEGYELEGEGPEWYVVPEGTAQPLAIIKLQYGKTVDGLIEGFERKDATEEVTYPDGDTGSVVTGSYGAPQGEEFVQDWYLRSAGDDGTFMMGEYKAKEWGPFQQVAESFEQTK